MASPPHPVGIIELDVDPHLKALSDEDLGQTLRRLRSVSKTPRTARRSHHRDYKKTCQHASQSFVEAIATLTADLQQIHQDLESELAKLLERLLWPDSSYRAG